MEKKAKKIEAFIHLQILCDCPHCDEQVDLMEIQELTCEGMLHRVAFQEPFWGNEDANLEVECTECRKEFKVGRIYN